MEYFELILWTFIGLTIGSFLNVCIDRVPLKLYRTKTQLNQLKSYYTKYFIKKYVINNSISIFKPIHSFCFTCNHKINWYENIPVISYILCRGVCSKCKTRIGSKIIWTETTHGLFYMGSAYIFDGRIFTFFICSSFSFLWFLINFFLYPRNLAKIT